MVVVGSRSQERKVSAQRRRGARPSKWPSSSTVVEGMREQHIGTEIVHLDCQKISATSTTPMIGSAYISVDQYPPP